LFLSSWPDVDIADTAYLVISLSSSSVCMCVYKTILSQQRVKFVCFQMKRFCDCR